ncbi:snare-like protein [Ascodesmis nigricans]|uniref:Protein transport protein SEC22 n=1 Tax=Ascodesmis nigricans TaxID=341454 RepID=A0A4S2N8F4_9PEZI|nr:snare-like protein [Ascodesmis nigricans]
MIKSTQIYRLDGVPLAATVDDTDPQLRDLKPHLRSLLRSITPNSEPCASISASSLTIHYLITPVPLLYLCITESSYPRKLAFHYLSDISTEFETTNLPAAMAPNLRPYAFVQFDTFMQKTKRTYEDTRATANLGRLNDDLKDVTRVMTKNIEDLLYRGDSLERMGDMSSQLREESRKYRKKAKKINWDLMVKQYAPFGVVGLILILFIWWRFF